MEAVGRINSPVKEHVPKQTQQQTRYQHDPQANQPMRQIGGPAPLITGHRTIDATSYQVATKDEENHDGLVSAGRETVGRKE